MSCLRKEFPVLPYQSVFLSLIKNKVMYNTEPFPVFHIIWIFGLLFFAFYGWVCPILAILAILGNKYDLYSFLIIIVILK